MKKILITLAALSGFFISQKCLATCSNYTTYTTGQTLTSSSLNSLQSNYTNCVNEILNGDTFTGNMLWYSGANMSMYSDTGSTLKFGVDGGTGNITTEGQINLGTGGVVLNDDGDGALTITGAGNGSDEDITLNLDDTSNTGFLSSSTGLTTLSMNNIGMNFYSDAGITLKASVSSTTGKIIGAPYKLGTYNVEIVRYTSTYTNDSIKIQCGGTSCSVTNPGYVVMNGTTAGSLSTFSITSNVVITLTGATWGADGSGDISGRILRVLSVNDNGTLKWCVALLGGRDTILTGDTTATAINAEQPETALCDSGISTSTNTVYEVGYFKSSFLDTGGSEENMNTVDTGVSDVVTGKSADGLWQDYNPQILSGFSPTPSLWTSKRWTQIGRKIHVKLIRNSGSGGSSSNTLFLITFPTKGRSSSETNFGAVAILNGGTETTNYGKITQNSTNTQAYLYTTPSGGGWSGASLKSASVDSTYEVGPQASFIE